MIGSSSVPNRAWLKRGVYPLPNREESRLDSPNEGGVESDVEVPDETGSSEEGL